MVSCRSDDDNSEAEGAVSVGPARSTSSGTTTPDLLSSGAQCTTSESGEDTLSPLNSDTGQPCSYVNSALLSLVKCIHHMCQFLSTIAWCIS